MRRYRAPLFATAATALLLAGWYFYSASNDDLRISSVATEKVGRDAVSATPDPVAIPAEPDPPIENGISGHVYMSGSVEPVADVIVEARPYDPAHETLSASTDETGSYSIAGAVPRQEYMIVADAPDRHLVATERPFVQLNEGEVRTGVDLYLWEGAIIRGEVTARTIESRKDRVAEALKRNDEALLVRQVDEPLPGVTVRAVADRVGREEPLTAVTGADGRYEIRHVPAASVRVRAEPPEGVVRYDNGHESQVRTVNTSTEAVHENVDFYFRFDGISVTGRVTDVEGQSIAGAEVVAERPAFDAWKVQPDGTLLATEKPGRRPTLSARALTDKDGFYSLEGFIPSSGSDAGGYRLRGSLPQESTYIFRVDAFGFVKKEMWVPMIGSNALSVTDAMFDEIQRMYAAETNAREPLVFPDLPVPSAEDNAIKLDFVMDREALVSGRVVDRRGNPQPGCKLSAGSEPRSIEGRNLGPTQVETDNLGRFVLSGLPAGEYEFDVVTAEGIGQTPRNGPLVVRAGDVIREYEVVIDTIEDLGTIEGHVLDAKTRDPIANFEVESRRAYAVDRQSPLNGGIQKDEENPGVFTITGLSEGGVNLQVSAEGFGRHESIVQIKPSQTTRLEILIQPEAMVVGRLMREGVPTSGQVNVAYKEPLSGDSFYRHADDNGYFEIRGLPAGDVVVQASIAERTTTGRSSTRLEFTHLALRAGQQHTVDFDFRGSAMVSGNVTLHGENPYCRIYVFGVNAPEPVPISDSYAFSQHARAITVLRENGPYEIRGLKPGTYKVVAVVTNSVKDEPGQTIDANERELSRVVTIVEGDSAELDFDL